MPGNNDTKSKMTYKNIRLIICILVTSTIFSCGDLFSFEKKIVDKYYLMETDSKEDLAIYYKTSDGDYVGRIPAKVLEYGFNDSVIVAKCKKNNSINYYIVHRNQDSNYADQKDFLTGPLSEKEFNEEWHQRLKMNFIKVQ